MNLVVAERTVVKQDEVHVIWLGPSDAPNPEPYSEPETIEMAYAAGELDNVQIGVWALMDTHALLILPNPVTIPTSDMSRFPDASGTYVLYGFVSGDKTVNYVNKQYTKGTYTVDACGKVSQVTTGYE